MQVETEILGVVRIESDADFVLFSGWHGVMSEHCTLGEARAAKYKQATNSGLGEQLPVIYQRQDEEWVLVG